MTPALGPAMRQAARRARLTLAQGPFFAFQGRIYRYFRHPYNRTWQNERCVEVPIVRRHLARQHGGRALEVGNVLSHYGTARHDIVDKYERGEGVFNVDIVDFRPAHSYDLILSISTLEHVGWDESPRSPDKALQALEHLQGLLRPGGRLVYTFPVGHNPALDEAARRGAPRLGAFGCLRRASGHNRWRECPWPEARACGYDAGVPTATAIVVGTWTRQTD